MVVREGFLEEEEVTVSLSLRHLWVSEGKRRRNNGNKEIASKTSGVASLF